MSNKVQIQIGANVKSAVDGIGKVNQALGEIINQWGQTPLILVQMTRLEVVHYFNNEDTQKTVSCLPIIHELNLLPLQLRAGCRLQGWVLHEHIFVSAHQRIHPLPQPGHALVTETGFLIKNIHLMQ